LLSEQAIKHHLTPYSCDSLDSSFFLYSSQSHLSLLFLLLILPIYLFLHRIVSLSSPHPYISVLTLTRSWVLTLYNFKAGMSKWRPAGRMQPLCLFCAARIGIFIMLQFNSFAFLPIISLCLPQSTLLSWVLHAYFKGLNFSYQTRKQLNGCKHLCRYSFCHNYLWFCNCKITKFRRAKNSFQIPI